MRLDILALECFMAVAETGSFTLASKKVFRTQSAISQQIAKLEKQLGKPLINRGKSFTLTCHGDMLLGYAKQILNLEKKVVARFEENDLAGEVKFGLPEDFASVFLKDILDEFFETHSKILLNIECDLTVNLFNNFKAKKFDLALVKMNRPEDFPHSFEIWSECLKWVGDEHLINTNQALPLVLSPSPCVYRAAAIKALDNAGIAWHMVFSSPNFSSTIAAV